MCFWVSVTKCCYLVLRKFRREAKYIHPVSITADVSMHYIQLLREGDYGDDNMQRGRDREKAITFVQNRN